MTFAIHVENMEAECVSRTFVDIIGYCWIEV